MGEPIEGFTKQRLIDLMVIINNSAPVKHPVGKLVVPKVGKIHTTIGVYLNGDYKTNGVHEEHLEDHINYNKTMRPGRALIVDGVIVYLGYYDQESLEALMVNKKLVDISVEHCTAPYH